MYPEKTRKETLYGLSVQHHAYIDLKALQCIESKTMQWIERVLTKGNGMASVFVYFVYICCLFLSMTFI